MDRARMIGEIVQRLGVKLGEDDPAFVLVELNRLALEHVADSLVERLAPIPGTIEQAGRHLAQRVAEASGRKINENLAGHRAALAKEADAARAAAAKAIAELAISQRRSSSAKWVSTGMMAVALIGVGAFAAGYATAQGTAIVRAQSR